MSAEQNLLDSLKQYQLGVIQSVSSTLQTGQMDQLTAQVAQEVSTSIPGGAETAQAAGNVIRQLAGIVGAGPYSAISRVGNDIASFNISGLISDIFSGRTFNTDQYWGAVYYYRYVLGQNVNNQNQISDGQVTPALKWFIDKLGVFISGREHLEALQKGPQQYMALASVNSYTTTDTIKVNNAVAVMKDYMPQQGYGYPPGMWANAVGVFDAALVNLVTGSAAWQSALSSSKQTYTQTDVLPIGTSASIIPGISLSSLPRGNKLFYGLAAAVLLILIILLL